MKWKAYDMIKGQYWLGGKEMFDLVNQIKNKNLIFFIGTGVSMKLELPFSQISEKLGSLISLIDI